MPVEHAPPGRPQANSVIDRIVGFLLAGIRVYLTTGGLPNSLWPFIGRAFAVNYCLTHAGEDGLTPYERVSGEFPFKSFVPGELVFSK